GEHALEQLHHHGANADEETGSEVSLQDVTDRAGWVQFEMLRLRIQLFFQRREHDVATGLLQPVAVSLQGARVRVEILVWCKLQSIHKDAGDHHIAQRLCAAHQVKVTVMQIAHRWHKSWRLEGAQRCAQVIDGVYELHGR